MYLSFKVMTNTFALKVTVVFTFDLLTSASIWTMV